MPPGNDPVETDLPMRSVVTPVDPQLDHSLSFGPRMLQHFTFDPEYRNMNNGSFGAAPLAIQQKLHHYHRLSESQPDPFIRYTLPALIDDSRAAAARLLNAPTSSIVLVPNATVATSAILYNIPWNPDGLDEILSFSTLYGATGRNIDFILSSQQDRGITSREIPLTYSPYLSSNDILSQLRTAISDCRASGRRPRLCILDTVSSLPAIRLPFERIVAECRDQGIQTLVDGAQGIGMLPDLDLEKLDPDFFLTNCHKWLHVPRGCAVLYVPERNQGMMRTTVPTSHGYVPAWEDEEDGGGRKKRVNPLPPSGKSRFVQNFQFTGTLDQSPMYCIKDAIEWRKEVCGGEERITEYVNWLAKVGGRKAAEVLGTREVLGEKRRKKKKAGSSGEEGQEESEEEVKGCGMTNVRLPLWFGSVKVEVDEYEGDEGRAIEETVMAREDEAAVKHWMGTVMTEEYKTWIPVFSHGGKFWARISAQVWLDIDDFEWAGKVLLELCRRAGNGEHRKGGES